MKTDINTAHTGTAHLSQVSSLRHRIQSILAAASGLSFFFFFPVVFAGCFCALCVTTLSIYFNLHTLSNPNSSRWDASAPRPPSVLHARSSSATTRRSPSTSTPTSGYVTPHVVSSFVSPFVCISRVSQYQWECALHFIAFFVSALVTHKTSCAVLSFDFLFLFLFLGFGFVFLSFTRWSMMSL